MNPRHERPRGFSLIEMMVAIGLLSLVILVLFSLFNQTTRAMRANSNQTDVMEGARSGFEIISRDLENMAASGVPGAPNFVTYPTDTARELFKQSVQQLGVDMVPIHQDVFFLERVDSKRLKVVGFVVRNEDESALRSLFPVGTLYRYEDPDPRTANNTLNPTRPANFNYLPMVVTSPEAQQNIAFRMLDRPRTAMPPNSDEDGTITRSAVMTNLARVTDGVVSFRITAYDQYNRPLDHTIWNYPDYGSSAPIVDNRYPKPPLIPFFDSVTVSTNYTLTGSSIFIQRSRLATDSSSALETAFAASVFVGESLPTTVEIEMAVMEPRALDQLRAMPPNKNNLTGLTPREKYLKNNLGKIQIFRQRVPILAAHR